MPRNQIRVWPGQNNHHESIAASTNHQAPEAVDTQVLIGKPQSSKQFHRYRLESISSARIARHATSPFDAQ